MDMATEEFCVKIADLGYSRMIDVDEKAMTGCGTPLQMAPEILFAKGYDYKVDVWAMGALYFTMLTNMFVFNADSMRQLEHRVHQGNWIWPKKVDFSLQGLQFLQKTFQYRPEDRISWEEIVHHPYLTLDETDAVPLNIVYDLADGVSSSYNKDGYLIINTKNPQKFNDLYQEASLKMMKHGERIMEEEMNKLVDGHSSSLGDALLAANVT